MAEATRGFLAEQRERVAANHAASVADGEHDEKCEFDVRGFYLCHCSKRRREAAGLTKPPTEDLYFPPPSCPNCHEALWHEDDSWGCAECALTWDSDGHGCSARFNDDYGDDLEADLEQWRATQPNSEPERVAGEGG